MILGRAESSAAADGNQALVNSYDLQTGVRTSLGNSAFISQIGDITSLLDLAIGQDGTLNYPYFFDGLIFGGGIDYENCLNSDCITLKFESDDTLNAEGFEFKWNCNDAYCEVEDSIKLQIDTSVSHAEILDYLLNVPGLRNTAMATTTIIWTASLN